MATTLASSSPIESARCKATHTHTHTVLGTVGRSYCKCALVISSADSRQSTVNSHLPPSPLPFPFQPPLPRANSFVIYVRSCLLCFAQSASHCPVLVVAVAVALGVVFCCKGSRSFDLPFVYSLALPLRAISGFTVTASPTKNNENNCACTIS